MSNWTGMRTVHKRGGMAQSVEHIVHIDGGKETDDRRWRMKRGSKRPENCPVDSFQWRTGGSPGQGSVVSNKSCERQRSRTPIANLTERAKRSKSVGSSPTVTTEKPIQQRMGFFVILQFGIL